MKSWVRIPPTPFRILGKFIYPTLPKSLGMLLVYPKRMAVGVKPIEVFCEEFKIEPIIETIKTDQLRWFCHVMRRDEKTFTFYLQPLNGTDPRVDRG